MTFTERRHDTGIYEIRNVIDGKRYIGSAVSLRLRWRQHKCALEKGTRKANRRLLNAWRKYGGQNFQFRHLVYCAAEHLIFYEQAVIDSLAPEYNIRKDAASNLGIRMTEETRRRISEAQKGVRKGPQSEEHRKANSIARRRKRLSESHRRRLSDVQKGKVISLRTRKNMSKLSDEAVAEIRRRLADGHVQAHIARDFGVSDGTIHKIKRGITYPWVEAA